MKALILITSLLFVSVAHADFAGVVSKVSDGDTITVIDSSKILHRVRMIGIDAPEKKQAFGLDSKLNLSTLILNKNVIVVSSKTDLYGRELGKVVLNGLDINLEQVKAGLAWHYKAYISTQDVRDRQLYADAENFAKIAKIGLWVDQNPVPPWVWRKK